MPCCRLQKKPLLMPVGLRKRVSLFDDLQKINEVQCARNSLLSGIASGAGIGVIRGMSSGAYFVRLGGSVLG